MPFSHKPLIFKPVSMERYEDIWIAKLMFQKDDYIFRLISSLVITIYEPNSVTYGSSGSVREGSSSLCLLCCHLAWLLHATLSPNCCAL